MNDDLIITVHCFERMEERWPALVMHLDDNEIAHLIQGEINDATHADRRARICPLELANRNTARWKADKDIWYVWNEGKERGYVVSEKEDGVTVLTTLVGQETETAKQKLRKH